MFIAACSTFSDFSSGRFGEDYFRGGAGVTQAAGQNPEFGGVAPGALSRGSDQYIDRSALSGRSQAIVVPAGGDNVEISLVDASVEAAADAILAQTLGLNYVVSNEVTATITIQTTAPIPRQALLDLFQASLSANRATMVQDDGIVRIVPATSGNRNFQLASDGAGGPGAIIVAPLEFISTTEMIGLLEPLIDEGLNVVADSPRNLLLLSGPTPLLEAALDALNLFDTSVLEGKSVAIVRLTSASPDAIVEELRTIFATGQGGALNGVVEFVPNERLGSVLIISSRSSYMDEARRWIRELDQTASSVTPYLQSYNLESREAAEIAPILSAMMEDGGGSEGSVEGQSVQASRVAADPSRNALIVRGTRSEHNEVLAILRRLDTPARQVLIEATIAEVTLNEEVNVGVRWFFESGRWNFRSSDLTSGAVVGDNPGFSAVFGAGGAEVALSALASVTDVNVISSPTVMVVDNREGILQIGDQVPIASQTSSDVSGGTDPVVITQVEYRDTGIILRVKPRISAHGQVTLDIAQEVSDVSANRTSGIDSPTISQRRIETSVVLTDGQTLALGGLVQESDNAGRAQVPGVGDVPVLGALFGERTSRRERTELLILIRPRVVFDASDAQNATTDWRTRLSATDSILDTGLGDPRHELGDILN